jgi:hypothetical protein
MKNIIVITGASSGFGALAARALAIRWEEVFRAQGMKNPTPRIQMIEGFNEGWIEPAWLGPVVASIAVDRSRIAEASYWRTPISPGTILDLRQIANSLIEAAEGFWSQRRFGK